MRFYLLFIISLLNNIAGWTQSNESRILESLKKRQLADPARSTIICDSLLQESAAKDVLFAAKIRYFKAKGFNLSTHHKKAIRLVDEIMVVFNRKNEYDFMINSLLLKSNANNNLKNYSQAINDALEALQLAKDQQLDKKIASIYSEIAFSHYGSGDFFNAIDYMLQVEAQQLKIKDTIGLSSTYNNIAVLYKNMHQYDNALKYNQKSLAFNIDFNLAEGIPKSHNNIGLIYFLINDYENAKKHFEKAIAANEQYNLKTTSPLTNLGEMYMELEEYDLAETYYNRALQYALKSNNDYKLRSVYDMLLKVNLQKKNFRNSYTYQSKIDSLSNILSKIEADEKIKMLENKHDIFQKEQDLIAAKENAKLSRIIFIVILSLFVFAALFFIQKQKTNKLKTEKDMLMLEQTILRSQMNPHFIFNALSAIQNTVMDNDPIKSASYLSRFAKLIRQNFEFTSKRFITLQEDLDALENYIETQKLRLKYPLKYQFHIDSSLNPHTIEIPPMLLQPFIENAIEHGLKDKKEGALVVINITKKNQETITITITDNGKGYSPKPDQKLHSTEVILKRLELLGKGDEKSFSISNLEGQVGTLVKFSIHTTL